MLKYKIGDRIRLKIGRETIWEVVEKNDEYYVLTPFNWDRELRVGMITDDQIQGYAEQGLH